jgi:hypothetical protein
MMRPGAEGGVQRALRSFIASLLLAVAYWAPACAGVTKGPATARLLEFRSADCLACDAMADALAAEPGWPALIAQAPVTPHTADDADATRLKIGRVPTWLLVNAQGEELGRIAGAQPATAAIGELRARLNARITATARSAQASEISRQGAVALAEKLARFHAANDGNGGFAWWLKLPIAVRGQQSLASPAVLHWRNRIELLQAAQRGRGVDVIDAGHKVLDDPAAVGCDFGLELARVLDGSRGLDPAERRAALGAFRVPSAVALAKQAFNPASPCTDDLPLVLATADLMVVLGDTDAERRVLMDAVTAAERRQADADTRRPRVLPRQLAALRARLGATS